MFKFFEEHFVPIAARIGGQRHLVAIRDGFASLMPIIMAGSFAVLLNAFPFPGWDKFLQTSVGVQLKTMNGTIWWGSMAMLSIFLVFSVAYQLAKSYDANGLQAGLISVSSFLIMIPQAPLLGLPEGVTLADGATSAGFWGNINVAYTGAQGMFVGMMIALIATELFVKLSKTDALVIKMPEGVPPAVSKSFAALFPGMIVLAVMAIACMILGQAADHNIFATITKYVGAPIKSATDSLGSALIIVFFQQFLWFFGLHGPNIIGAVTEPILLQLLEENMVAVAAGQVPPHIITKPFLDSFVHLGGSGATLTLLGALFFAGKRKQNREIAKLGVAPGLFNINEPVIFGFPIVLNPVLFIPFVFGPLVLTIVAYVATWIGLVPRTIAMVPWTFPPVIGGFFATASIQGAILALVNLCIGFAIYLPFVYIIEAMEAKKDAEKKAA
jgi:PTS system cellobiose-specific IIC component